MATKARKPSQKKTKKTPDQKIIGVCIKYEAKIAKNDSQYADVSLKDETGKIYNCKLWNFQDAHKEYLFPRKYVVIATVKRSDYQGMEQYTITDLAVDDSADVRIYDPSIIDTEDQYNNYVNYVSNVVVMDPNWRSIIKELISQNTVQLSTGIVDNRLGGNQNGTLLRSVFRATRMAMSLADNCTAPIDTGYLCYIILMNGLAKSSMYEMNKDGVVATADACNFFGFVALPLLSIPKLFKSENLVNVPYQYKQMAIHGILSATQAGPTSLYPAIYSNSIEGRIAYHASTLDYVYTVSEQYVNGTSDSLVSIPELLENVQDKSIKFVVPKRIIGA